ncbi:MAG: ATP-binding protein, partial [Elusimicrobia bacterium]|nr:ATP-binding protein [Elusimicrobiota bacterium]
MARPAPKSASAVPSIVKDLVDQFDRPLDFFRELIQNAIDAGSNRIDVSVEHDGEKAVIRVEDDGEGMDEYIIDNFLLVLFRSTKEEDFTKIGKFGIGFVSVFAPRPDMVRVYTAKNGESWRLDFPDYRRYEKYKLSKLREGSLVELLKKMTRAEADKLAVEAKATIQYWCRHADCRIYFRSAEQPQPEPLSEPYRL